jgi:hypothetical protein
MAVNVATLTAKIKADTKDFKRGMSQVEGRLGKTANKFRKFDSTLGKGLGAVAGVVAVKAIVGVGKAILDTGVQVEAWGRRYETVFGEAAAATDAFISEFGARFGIAEIRLKGVAAGLGDLLIPMGFTRAAAADMTIEMLSISNALSEWTGGQRDAAEVADILAKGMLGEREGLKSLGVAVLESDVTNKLLAKGQQHLTGTAREQAKATATLEIIVEKSTDAMAAYAEGGTDAMNAQKDLNLKLDEAKVALSEKLIPAVTLAAEALAAAIPFVVDFTMAIIDGVAEIVKWTIAAEKWANNLFTGAKMADLQAKAADQVTRSVHDLSAEYHLLHPVMWRARGEFRVVGEAMEETRQAEQRLSLEMSNGIWITKASNDALGLVNETRREQEAGLRRISPVMQSYTEDLGGNVSVSELLSSSLPKVTNRIDLMAAAAALAADPLGDAEQALLDVARATGRIGPPSVSPFREFTDAIVTMFGSDLPAQIKANKFNIQQAIREVIELGRIRDSFERNLELLVAKGYGALADALASSPNRAAAILAAAQAVGDLEAAFLLNLGANGVAGAAIDQMATFLAGSSAPMVQVQEAWAQLGGLWGTMSAADWIKRFEAFIADQPPTAQVLIDPIWGVGQWTSSPGRMGSSAPLSGGGSSTTTIIVEGSVITSDEMDQVVARALQRSQKSGLLN